jgi:hypothetical protein
MGATAIVANPVVLPPADVRVSAADYAASGSGIDLLDPRFLELIGAGGQNPVEVLESLLSGLVSGGSGGDVSPLASSLRVPDVGDPALLMSTLAAVTIGDLQRDGVGTGVLGPSVSNQAIFGGLFPAGGAREVVRVLAEIGEGFGEAGATFLQQIGMAPAMVAELAKQVQAGTLDPGEALIRLVAVPFTALTGYPQLTGDPEIDAAFTDGVLRPVVDAFVNNLPAPIQEPGGPIDSIDSGESLDTVATAPTDMSNSVAPSAPQSSVQVAAGDDQTTDEAVTEPPLAPAVPEAETADGGKENGTDNGDDATPGTGPSSGRPGGSVDHGTKTNDDFGIPILTGGGGHKPGKGGGSSAGSPGSAAGGKGSSAGS